MSQYVLIKKSKIHGSGVFASKNIPKNKRIIEYVGDIITKRESDKRYQKALKEAEKDPEKGVVYLFEIDKKHDIDGNVEWNPARLINHSCTSNCRTENIDNRIWIIANKTIEEGTEITYNYGYAFEDYEDHPCLCQSDKCIGYILDKKHWSKLKSQKKKE